MVKDYVRTASLRGREMFVPLKRPAGEAQVECCEALVVMDLPHLDDCFVVAFPAETTEAFLEGHVDGSRQRIEEVAKVEVPLRTELIKVRYHSDPLKKPRRRWMSRTRS